MLCSFPGCPNQKSKKAAKGLCSSHYWQLHKGRELTPLAYRKYVTEDWLLAHVDYGGDECLIWPFGRHSDGRGGVKFRGVQQHAHRVMCKLAHGEPPTPKHEAAHSCGKGNEGCVNPRHLRWATHIENEADKVAHGTSPRGERQGSAKLTTSDVLQIRAMQGTASQAAIAAQFGVRQSTVFKIIHRQRWGHI